MTIQIELTPEEERRVRAAEERGLDVTALLRGVLAGLPAPAEERRDRTLELLAEWAQQDATDDPEELARRDQELEEFKANINMSRAASGEEPVY